MQQLLKLLADSTRTRILLAVEKEELSVNEITEVLNMNQSRISNHLRLLRDGGALTSRREGAWTFYRNNIEATPVWRAVRPGLAAAPSCKADETRRRGVLDKRRRRSRAHFAAGAANGVALETGSLRSEILAALAPPEWLVVDAGCGDGFLTELLGERFARVVAFDHSPERLAAARERVGAAHVRFDAGEVDDLPLRAGSVDALFFSMVLHHVPEIAAAVAEAFRVLRPGGRIVIADLAPHDEESMRERMGDLRLGLEAGDVTRSLSAAGFDSVHTLPVADRLKIGHNRHLDLILATGTRPVKQKTKRRTK